jgi:hypothetical protein
MTASSSKGSMDHGTFTPYKFNLACRQNPIKNALASSLAAFQAKAFCREA